MRLIEGFTEVAVSIGSTLFAGGVGAGLIRPNTKRFSDIFEGWSWIYRRGCIEYLPTRMSQRFNEEDLPKSYRGVIVELSRSSRSFRRCIEELSRLFEAWCRFHQCVRCYRLTPKDRRSPRMNRGVIDEDLWTSYRRCIEGFEDLSRFFEVWWRFHQCVRCHQLLSKDRRLSRVVRSLNAVFEVSLTFIEVNSKLQGCLRGYRRFIEVNQWFSSLQTPFYGEFARTCKDLRGF